MKYFSFFLFLALLSSTMSAAGTGNDSFCNIIPVPEHYEHLDGSFIIPECGLTFRISGSEQAASSDELESFADYLKKLPMGEAGSRKKASVEFRFMTARQSGLREESYRMKVSQDRIVVEASSVSGAFYAVQTLAQMTYLWKLHEISCCMIEDSPRFSYRGMHMDVSRHFRSKEFIMKQIDAMALMKMNRLHLHLTDGAGWRMEVESYPRLTEFAAWRLQRKWSDWVSSGSEYCEKGTPGAYGGYYTKADLKEIVSYAEARHIDVIPEIEMPGHSEEVLAAYPELSCSGRPYADSDFCPGKEETFRFIEDVLTEVMEVFPGEYIHIGGDEAGKNSWKTCPDCIARMEREGLEGVDELQSYLVHRVEEFVNSKGRRIIGWDEILQGGLAPNATVMSWRGTEGGLQAISSGHDVIMTPVSHCYLDYTQDAPFREPVSMGGYLPLEKVYSYEPRESSMSDEDMKHLLGVQANLWAEWVKEDSHAEYMYYPRSAAIAEIGWSRPENRNYEEFRARAGRFTALLREMGYNAFDLSEEYGNRRESLDTLVHLASGCPVDYKILYAPNYPGTGDSTLTDSFFGGWSYGDGRWQGFRSDIDMVVDLKKNTPIRYIGVTFMQQTQAWVHMPVIVRISVSEDGISFVPVAEVPNDVPGDCERLLFKTFQAVCNVKARYVRIQAENLREETWLFTDEIVVN